ncbi:MAG: helix-turn-helix domain-containing protein [Saprospiraceae bacterium]|nr:helix-turn-helix domain-containing protein [Saprospiraceae bacterium]
MSNSEILNSFDEGREAFKPYGLTCELWTPSLMKKADRHNEIEINYCSGGSLTYLLQDKKITIPKKRLAVFWGLVSHQIIRYEGEAPYFVCTIPFSLFLEWKLSNSFVDRILKGEVLVENSEAYATYDEFLIGNWIQDIHNDDSLEVILLEMRARLSRLAISSVPKEGDRDIPIHSNEISQVERMAIYIARHYSQSIKAIDIGKAVGLHPDYANTVFKKTFGSTISQYIIEERISHARRKLVTTDTSITEIAFDSGFNSISRFNAAFRRINSCTPREFRKGYK